MKFRTEYLPTPATPLDPTQGIVLLGSCFSDNIGACMTEAGWPATVNPCGTLFNPLSIARMLSLASMKNVERAMQVHERMKHHDDLWLSWDFSTLFSGKHFLDCFGKCLESLIELRDALEKAQALIITLGTAWIYRLAESGNPVTNCHKFPESNFVRSLDSVDTLADALDEALTKVKSVSRPDLRIILTLSPVRHLRDGMEGNSLSKATLRLVIDRLVARREDTEYFPAYEILLDDLRDYRFYADDLIHPSSMAVKYIWEKFTDRYITPDGLRLLREGEAKTRRARHRALR